MAVAGQHKVMGSGIPGITIAIRMQHSGAVFFRVKAKGLGLGAEGIPV
jgi:hypothetical protein